VTLRWILAAVHLLALGVGVGAIWMRARALRDTLDVQGLRRVFYADNFWALSFGLFVATGLWRLLGGVEKGTDYYLHQSFFHAKMGLLVLVLALEISPMITLIRWRAAVRSGQNVDTSRARSLARLSTIQALVLILMVFAATAMARGLAL
jgi:putative membrane protein